LASDAVHPNLGTVPRHDAVPAANREMNSVHSLHAFISFAVLLKVQYQDFSIVHSRQIVCWKSEVFGLQAALKAVRARTADLNMLAAFGRRVSLD
jgi:hypothetical protein